MSTTRLTFLYPHLFRAPRLSEPASQAAHLARRRTAARASRPLPTARSQSAHFATATSPKQSTYVTRHGKAVEPTPLNSSSSSDTPAPLSSQQPPKSGVGAAGAAAAATAAAPSPGKQQMGPEPASADKSQAGDKTAADSGVPPVIELGAPPQPPPPQPDLAEPSAEAGGGGGPTKHKSGPMETILHMGSPETIKKQLPHLATPTYVHRFDTYSLVKQLEAGGYTQAQAITAMKAVRALLAQNLDKAQEGLVSRRDVDNETYLFRAACSELSTEVKNNRRIADEQMRQQRTHVQHEVDITTQSLNQELVTLNDHVKGMFNDRRMAVREEQKAAESSIQQIHYKISVILNSDAKSDIEGLRWILIRRGVLGIIFMLLISLGALRYASYTSHEKQKHAQKQAEEVEAARKNDGKLDRSSAPDAAGILAAN